MAGQNFFATQSVSVAANTTKTLLQLLAATNVRFRVRRISVAVKGAAQADKPVKLILMRQSTAGTMTSLTLTKQDTDAAETLQTTAQHTATAEPTSGDEIWTAHANAFGGQAVYIPTDPSGLVINGGDRLGLVAVTDASASGAADISATIDAEE
jgi:hypothetical protein